MHCVFVGEVGRLKICTKLLKVQSIPPSCFQSNAYSHIMALRVHSGAGACRNSEILSYKHANSS